MGADWIEGASSPDGAGVGASVGADWIEGASSPDGAGDSVNDDDETDIDETSGQQAQSSPCSDSDLTWVGLDPDGLGSVSGCPISTSGCNLEVNSDNISSASVGFLESNIFYY